MPAPRDANELALRARELVGRTLGEIAAALGTSLDDDPRRTKGKQGELLERALGATPDDLAWSVPGDEGRRHDFPSLRVELKSIPLDARGRPKESTYVCRLSLRETETLVWETSWVREKLANVLWVAFDATPEDWWDRRIMHAFLWAPTADQEATLRADFDEVVGLFARGRAEAVTAHLGTALQVRPKARDGSVRTTFIGPEGETLATIPRGFYLRPSFTATLLPAR